MKRAGSILADITASMKHLGGMPWTGVVFHDVQDPLEADMKKPNHSDERVQGYWPAKSSPILYVCDFCENGNHLHDTLSGRCVRVVGGQECQCRIVDVYVHRAKLMQAKDQE